MKALKYRRKISLFTTNYISVKNAAISAFKLLYPIFCIKLDSLITLAKISI